MLFKDLIMGFILPIFLNAHPELPIFVYW